VSHSSLGEQLSDNYADYYETEDAAWRRLGALDKAANIANLCGDVPHASILEIGAGDGAVLERLSELAFGEVLHAAEISPSAIDCMNRKRIPRLADARLFDGQRLPYGADSFDLAVLTHVLEHVEHPRVMLEEAARVARHVFVEVPLEDHSRMRRDFVFDHVGHINFYSPRTIRWLVQSCNLQVMQQTMTNPSKATYTYRRGQRGAVNYMVKQVLLQAVPSFAARHFSYHASLLCARPD
jgi:ubiquinone/menaquinone biosynthesis C-methylase UbiE